MLVRKRVMYLFLMVALAGGCAIRANANGPRTGIFREAYVQFVEGKNSTYVYIGGEVFQSRKGASYNAKTNTLTLENVKSLGSLNIFAMGKSFNIVLKGDNEIGYLKISGDEYGGNVTLKGNGTLVINRKRANKNAVFINSQYTDGLFHVCKTVTLKMYAKGNNAVVHSTNSKSEAVNKVLQIDGKSAKPIQVKETKQYIQRKKTFMPLIY